MFRKGSKLANALRERGVMNNHQLVKEFGVPGKDICINFHPNVGYNTSKSCVYSPSHKTDLAAAWYDSGKKAFCGLKADSMPKAIAWASEKYGVDEWLPSPFGGMIPAYIRRAAEESVKEAA